MNYFNTAIKMAFCCVFISVLSGFVPNVYAATQTELEQCRALSLQSNDIHNCLDNFLDELDAEMAVIEQEVIAQIGDPASDATIAFSLAQESFQAYRRDNCLWYQAFSEPAAEADQIAVSCLIEMSKVRLRELSSLLDSNEQSVQYQGFYTHADDRNSFMLCGEAERYWVTGDTQVLSQLQKIYAQDSDDENMLLYVVANGQIDRNVDTQVYPGHVGEFKLSGFIEARLPIDSDCRPLLTQQPQADNTPAAQASLEWQEVRSATTKDTQPVGEAADDTQAQLLAQRSVATQGSDQLQADTEEGVEAAVDKTLAAEADVVAIPDETPLAKQIDKPDVPVSDVASNALSKSAEPEESEADLSDTVAAASTDAVQSPLVTTQPMVLASTTTTEAQESTSSSDASSASSRRERVELEKLFSDEFAGEALRAYFGAWVVDCRNDGAQALCMINAKLNGLDKPEVLQPEIRLIRRSAARTVIDLIFPGQEIDSIENIRWKVDSVNFGVIKGSRMRADDAASRQELRQRTPIQKDILPQMVSGYELGITVLDAAGRRDLYDTTLMGVTRALLFADDFISSESG